MNDLARSPRNEIVNLQMEVGELVRHAAMTAIMPRFGQLRACDVEEKTSGEVVTIADHEAEEILTEGLKKILPDVRVIGEEACELEASLMQGLDKGLVWIVDPLDGTANFAAGREPFGVIIALAQEGVTTAAWLYNPITDRMCFASLGRGAFIRNGRRATRRVVTRVNDARPIAALATQFMSATLRNAVVSAATDAFEIRPIPRCAAEHYPMLALCENHIAVFQRTLPWDHAAGALFLSEAGGRVSRWDGSPYAFHDGGLGIVAASSTSLWKSALETLNGKNNLLAGASERSCNRSMSPPHNSVD